MIDNPEKAERLLARPQAALPVPTRVSERLAGRVLGQHRSTQRKHPTTPDDEAALTAEIIALARQHGRYGYRRVTALLRPAGWCGPTTNAPNGSGGGRG